MTEPEARDFLKQAFIAFPGVSQWVQEHSPDPKATIGIWAVALERVSAPEAISVLNRWIKNELPPPTGYQRELFVNHVVAVVKLDREKSYPAKHREKVFDQLNLRSRKESYVPVLGPMMRDIVDIKNEFDSGRISEDEKLERAKARELQAIKEVTKS